MTNLIIAGGTRRERSQTLLGRLEGGTGRRWLVAVPCGLPHDMPDGIHGIGLNDLDGALDAVGRVRPGDTLAVESVDYWAMGASEPIPNPDNNPNVARWNAMAAAAARKRARFRHAMQSLPDGRLLHQLRAVGPGPLHRLPSRHGRLNHRDAWRGQRRKRSPP